MSKFYGAKRDESISFDVGLRRLVRSVRTPHGRRGWRRNDEFLGRIEYRITRRVRYCHGSRWDIERRGPNPIQRYQEVKPSAHVLGRFVLDRYYRNSCFDQLSVGAVFQISEILNGW